MATNPNTVLSDTQFFTGEYRHSLDEKNRMTIPADWRNTPEGGEFFVIPNPNPETPCLTVVTPAQLKKMGEESAEHVDKKNHRIFLRQLYALAKRCSADRQGRLLLPDDYCRKLDLTGEVVLTGGFDRFEIWNVNDWNKFNKDSAKSFEEIAVQIGL